MQLSSTKRISDTFHLTNWRHTTLQLIIHRSLNQTFYWGHVCVAVTFIEYVCVYNYLESVKHILTLAEVFSQILDLIASHTIN